MPKNVFRVGSRIWRVMGLRVQVIEMLIFHQPSSKRDFPINGKGGFKMKINDAVLGSLNMIMSGVERLPLSFAEKPILL